jgi:hypothetical protein
MRKLRNRLLILFLASGWEQVSAGTLLHMEQGLVAIQALLDRYKLNCTATKGVAVRFDCSGILAYR